MDRRLAAIAGGVLAAAGALSMFGRRHQPVSIDPTPTDPTASLADMSGAPVTETHCVAMGWSSEEPFDLEQALAAGGSAPLPSPFYAVPDVEPEPVPARPLAEVLYDLVSGYSMDADRLLNLKVALRPVAEAIEAGTLQEGTVVVDFDWHPGAGIMMHLAIALLATREFVRIDVCDLDGVLRAPQLNVHIRGDDVQVITDRNAQTVDLDERRSEALVTSLKIKAIADGVSIHPGSAADVLARCRISASPFSA